MTGPAKGTFSGWMFTLTLVMLSVTSVLLWYIQSGTPDALWESESYACDRQLTFGAWRDAYRHAENALVLAETDTRRMISAQRIGTICEILGDVRMARSRYVMSVAAGEQLTDPGAFPEYRAALSGLSGMDVLMGHFETAESAARRLVMLSKDCVTMRDRMFMLARTYFQTGRWAESEKMLSDLLVSDTDSDLFFSAQCSLQVGELRLGEGRYPEAHNIGQALTVSLSAVLPDTDVNLFYPLMLTVRARMFLVPGDPEIPRLIDHLSEIASDHFIRIHPSNYRLMLLQAESLAVRGHSVEADSMLSAVRTGVEMQFGAGSPLMTEVNRVGARLSASVGKWADAAAQMQKNVDFWTQWSQTIGIPVPALYLPLLTLSHYQMTAGETTAAAASKLRADSIRAAAPVLFEPAVQSPFNIETLMRNLNHDSVNIR